MSVVAQVLEQASGVTAPADGSYEMLDYVVSLREGIMDAWGGIIGAMKMSNKSTLILHHVFNIVNNPLASVLQPHVASIFQLLQNISGDANRSESLLRAAMGVIG